MRPCQICRGPGAQKLVLDGERHSSLGLFCGPCERWLRTLFRTVVRNVRALVRRIGESERRRPVPLLGSG